MGRQKTTGHFSTRYQLEREIWAAYIHTGMHADQIAPRVGVSVGTVHKILNDASTKPTTPLDEPSNDEIWANFARLDTVFGQVYYLLKLLRKYKRSPHGEFTRRLFGDERYSAWVQDNSEAICSYFYDGHHEQANYNEVDEHA